MVLLGLMEAFDTKPQVEKLSDWILGNIDLRDEKEIKDIYDIFANSRGLSNTEKAAKLKDHFFKLYNITNTEEVSSISDDDLDFNLGV